MKLAIDKLTDQQCVDIIANFIKRKMVGNINEIIIHAGEDDIHIKKQPNPNLLPIYQPCCCIII